MKTQQQGKSMEDLIELRQLTVQRAIRQKQLSLLSKSSPPGQHLKVKEMLQFLVTIGPRGFSLPISLF